MLNKTSRVIFLVVLLLVTAGVAIGQTVHWKIKINTGELGQIIGVASGGAETPIITIPQSTGNVGIGTTNPTAKLNISGSNYVAFRADDATIAGSNKGYEAYIYSTLDGAQGTYIGNNTTNPLYLMTGYTARIKIISGASSYTGTNNDWKIGIGASPEAADARLVVCRTTSGAGAMCTIPTNLPTVALLGSTNNLTTGSSIRALGKIETAGNVRSAGGYETGGIDLGEYILIEGRVSDYEQGDALVISSQQNTFKKSGQKYDSKVAGIVTTTAGYIGGAPDEGTPAPPNKVVMALAGQLPAKVSAENGPIEVGDFLTTASRLGYLMKCPTETSEQKLRCMGTIVAKALEPLKAGQGKIMVLLTLQ